MTIDSDDDVPNRSHPAVSPHHGLPDPVHHVHPVHSVHPVQLVQSVHPDLPDHGHHRYPVGHDLPRGPERRRLVEHVLRGGLLQLAILRPDGAPVLCDVWYRATFSPDRLHFLARPERLLPGDLRLDSRVAGSIVTPPPAGPGPREFTVTFTGTARELAGRAAATELAGHLTRWPVLADTTDPVRLKRGEAPERMYRVEVTEWTILGHQDGTERPRTLPASP
ncbi:hypothetical protein AB0B89_04745 [Sphaerisporangium sp. NPDC049002]|uniref:hypothetical protein n=1 Tax=unclassified Sphaerisporangium TaxID=2630420 RepID=UPI0033E352F3